MVERRALRGVRRLRPREGVVRLVDLAADFRDLAVGKLALLHGREIVDALRKRHEGCAEVGGDLLRAVHLERLARDERFERLVETRVDRRVVPGLLRHVGEVADERLKLRGAAVGLKHRLHECVPRAGARVVRQGIQRIVEQFRKICLRVKRGLDRLADRVGLVPVKAAFLVLDEGIGDLSARELVDGLKRRLGLLRGPFDRLARRLVETCGDEGVLEGLGVNRRRSRLRRPEEHRVQVGGEPVRLV